MNAVSEEQLKIALVDDDPVFRDITCAFLSSRGKYKPFPAASGEGLFRILNEGPVDCILLDYDLGHETGFSIKERLDAQFPEASPVVMLTGNGRESTAINAFRRGVSDYLPKSDLDAKTLVTTISKAVAGERQRLIAKAEYASLVEAVTIDAATGLAGRLHLDRRVAQLSKSQTGAGRCYSVIAVEFLEYHSILDHYGIETADLALRAFAQKLKETKRSDDLCGRYAGGTFLIIKEFESDPAVLEALCHRLTEQLSFTLTTSFAPLKLSARASSSTYGPDRREAFEGLSRIIGSSDKAAPFVPARAVPVSDGVDLQAWVYTPL